jgi:hypothetical protein
MLSDARIDFTDLSRPVRVLVEGEIPDDDDDDDDASDSEELLKISRPSFVRSCEYEWSVCFGFADRDLSTGVWIQSVPSVEPRSTWKGSQFSGPVTPTAISSNSHTPAESVTPLAYGRIEWFDDLRRAKACPRYALVKKNSDHANDPSVVAVSSSRRQAKKRGTGSSTPKNMCWACFDVFWKREDIKPDLRHYLRFNLSLDDLTEGELLKRCELMRKRWVELKREVAEMENMLSSDSSAPVVTAN